MKQVFAILLTLFTVASSAQKNGGQKNEVKPKPVTLLTGDLKLLDTLKGISIKFTYDDMVIGKDTPENEFVAQRVKNWNEKESGKGKQWERYWYENRKLYYEVAFAKAFYFNSHLASPDPTGKYMLILQSKRTEIGWNTGMVHRAASIDAEVWVVESSDNSKVLAKIQLFDIRGKNANGGDFEMGLRIVEAYSKAGELLSRFIN